MGFTTQLAQIIESGKVTLYMDNAKDLEVRATNKIIDLNAINKEFVKEMFSAVRDASNKSNRSTQMNTTKTARTRRTTGRLQHVRNLLDTLKEAADELWDAGITVTLSYKGDRLVTLGAKANPKITHFLTGKSIEINNLPKLAELAIYIAS